MDTNLPLVTIITPAYNRADYLPETIESVLLQDYPNIEYIVLDDGSTDNTLEVLKKYSDKIIIHSHANIGETKTVNKGIGIATGEIISVVNSDDPLLPGAISTAVNYLQQNPNALAVYPDWLEIDENSVPIREHRLPDYSLWIMLKNFNVSIGPGTFIRSKAFELVGLRDEALRYTGDLEFWFRLAVYDGLIHMPEMVATHRTHQASASSSNKGPEMAGEVVNVLYKLFSNHMLPAWDRKLRNYSLSIAHHDAVFYLDNDWVNEIKHRLASIFYSPFTYVYRCAYGVDTPVRSEKYKKLWSHLIKFGAKLPLPPRNEEISDPTAIPKFGFVSHVLPPSWSGQAVVLERLLNPLDPNHYCLISIRDYSQVAPEENNRTLAGKYFSLPKEPEIFPSSRNKLIRWINIGIRILHRGYSIARVARAQQCKILLAGTGDLIDLPAAFCASIFLGIPFVPYLFDDYTYQWTDPVTRALAKWAEALMFSHSATVVVPNEFLRDAIFERHGIVPVIIRNPGADMDYSLVEESSINKNKSDGVRIVYTGAVYHVNMSAFRNMIAAINKINEENFKLHIYTAQSIPWLESEGVGGDSVVFHQHVPPEDVAEAQSGADILLIPFSFGSTVPEIIKTSAPGKLGDYLASGTLVLAHVPPDSFVSWYLKKYDCGIVVEQDDTDILAEAISRIAKDRLPFDHIVHNAIARARIDFRPDGSRETFLRILKNIA